MCTQNMDAMGNGLWTTAHFSKGDSNPPWNLCETPPAAGRIPTCGAPVSFIIWRSLEGMSYEKENKLKLIASEWWPWLWVYNLPVTKVCPERIFVRYLSHREFSNTCMRPKSHTRNTSSLSCQLEHATKQCRIIRKWPRWSIPSQYAFML
jgi:hypothetical protein